MRKGTKHIPATLELMARAARGRVVTTETRAKISQTLRGIQRVGPLSDLSVEERRYYNKVRRHYSREESIAMVREVFHE